MLATDSNANLTWTWSETDPAIWEIQSSADEFSGFTTVDFKPGGERAASEGTTGVWYRLKGTDILGNQTVPYSDAVFASGS